MAFSFTEEENERFMRIFDLLSPLIFPGRVTLDIVIWSTEVGYICSEDEFMNLIESAPDIAEWLCEHENPPLSSAMMEMAVFNKRLHTVAWLLNHDCPSKKWMEMPIRLLLRQNGNLKESEE